MTLSVFLIALIAFKFTESAGTVIFLSADNFEGKFFIKNSLTSVGGGVL